MTTSDDFRASSIGYSLHGLARLAMSAAACELSDAARAAVPTSVDAYHHDHGHCDGGSWLEVAARIAAEGRDFLTATVVFERLRGATWEEIGKALGGITRQAAHDRYGTAVAEWEARAIRAWLNPDSASQLGPAVGDPAGTIRRLNEWVTGHEGTERDAHEDQVGLGLGANTLHDHYKLVIAAARLLLDTSTPAEERATLELAYARRKAELYARMNAKSNEKAQRLFAEIRARLTELEAQR